MMSLDISMECYGIYGRRRTTMIFYSVPLFAQCCSHLHSNCRRKRSVPFSVENKQQIVYVSSCEFYIIYVIG